MASDARKPRTEQETEVVGTGELSAAAEALLDAMAACGGGNGDKRRR